MGSNRIKDVEVMGPDHPSFAFDQAWYTFGVFSPDGSIRRFMLVQAKNRNAVNVLESLAQQDGSVSATCGLISVSEEEPQVRSTTMERISYVDFMIDMVEADRWLDSPFMVNLFQDSLSEVDRVVAGMKVDSIIREREQEEEKQEEKENLETVEPSISEPSVQIRDGKFEQLHAGLVGLGFAKRDVQSFVESVSHRSESVQDLLVEGIKKLNRGLS